MKKQILVLLVLVLFITGLSGSQYISNWPNMISSNIANEDMFLIEDYSATSAGTYFNITVAALATKLLGGATIGGTGAGDIVTIDDTQTLTNKILTSPVINSGTINNSTFTAMSIVGSVDQDTGNFYIFLNHATYDFKIRTATYPYNFFIDGSNGYIGINTGTPSAELDIVGDLEITGQADIDNININGNTISSTDTNGDINITPNGTGNVVFTEGDLKIGVTALTSTGTELNILDGITSTTAELNYVHGVTSQIAGMTENHAEDYTTGTGASQSLSGSGVRAFNTTLNAISANLPEISNTKSQEYLCILTTDGGNDVSIRNHASDAGFVKADGTTTGASITLNDVGDFVFLKSSCYPTGYWMIIGGEGYVLVP